MLNLPELNLSKPENDRLIKMASYYSVMAAIIITFVKFYGWLATDSQSILVSIVDSMLDISSALINFFAIRVSLLPADNNHRFGHEKFQDLAIFSQAIFFSISGLFTLFSSIKTLFYATRITHYEFGTNIMYISIFITILVILYQEYVTRKTESRIIQVDKLHYITDLLANVAVLLSLYLSNIFWFIDAATGILISLYIIYIAYGFLKKAIKNLVDEELPQADKDKIIKIISSFKEISGLHELKTRYAADKPFIQFHIEMNGDISLYKAHLISDNIAKLLMKEFPNAEITIHQDPAGTEQNVNYREQL